MPKARFFDPQKVSLYKPHRFLDHESSYILYGNGTKKYYVDYNNPVGKGHFGSVHEFQGTNILRKKLSLANETEYLFTQKELEFHKKYYGKRSIIIGYFDSDGNELKDSEIKNRLENGCVYCSIIRNKIEGTCLSNALETHKDDPEKSLLLYLKITAVLFRLNNLGIIHGDFKFDNFIVDRYFNVFPIDFAASSFINMPAVLGDPKNRGDYVAPERFTDNSEIKSHYNQDIYSFGYAAATEANIKISLSQFPSIIDLFQEMLSENPAQRPTLEKIITTLMSVYKEKYPQKAIENKIEDLFKSRCNYTFPLVGLALSSLGLFASVNNPLSFGMFVTACATGIPLGLLIVSFIFFTGWLARNAYVNYNLPEPAGLKMQNT